MSDKEHGFLNIQQKVVVTHRFCGSAVRAFMWNMPAGWWEVKCYCTQTTESKNRRGNAQPETQLGSRTNPGSEICNNLTHYVTICISKSVSAWMCMLVGVFIYVHMCDNYNVCSCNTLMAFCQVLPHGELMPSINSACIYQVRTQQFAACKLLLGYLHKFPKLTAYE